MEAASECSEAGVKTDLQHRPGKRALGLVLAVCTSGAADQGSNVGLAAGQVTNLLKTLMSGRQESKTCSGVGLMYKASGESELVAGCQP